MAQTSQWEEPVWRREPAFLWNNQRAPQTGLTATDQAQGTGQHRDSSEQDRSLAAMSKDRYLERKHVRRPTFRALARSYGVWNGPSRDTASQGILATRGELEAHSIQADWLDPIATCRFILVSPSSSTRELKLKHHSNRTSKEEETPP